MWRLVPALVREIGPGLSGAAARRIVDFRRRSSWRKATSFRKTLGPAASGLLNEATRGRWPRVDRLDGETAFKLYDTFGFPLHPHPG